MAYTMGIEGRFLSSDRESVDNSLTASPLGGSWISAMSFASPRRSHCVDRSGGERSTQCRSFRGVSHIALIDSVQCGEDPVGGAAEVEVVDELGEPGRVTWRPGECEVDIGKRHMALAGDHLGRRREVLHLR